MGSGYNSLTIGSAGLDGILLGKSIVHREVQIGDGSSVCPAPDRTLGFFPHPGPGILGLRSFNGIFPCSFLGRCARAVGRQRLRECPKLDVSVIISHSKVIFKRFLIH